MSDITDSEIYIALDKAFTESMRECYEYFSPRGKFLKECKKPHLTLLQGGKSES